VKVADFGLARVIDDRRQIELTDIGVTMGTPLYMSPEQVEGRAVDKRSDIYSLGVTLYHMLAGHPPFDGDTPLNVAVQHLHKDPPRLAERRFELPDALCQIVHRMLAKDPADRFATAADLLDELRAVPLERPRPSWPQDIGLADSESDLTVTTARFAETQQLATVMRQSGRQSRTARSWPWWLAACVLGGCLAWVARPVDPLAQSLASTEMLSHEKHGDIRAQFAMAIIANTEEAWRGIIDQAADGSEGNGLGQYMRLRAKEKLARLYLDEAKYDLALSEFGDLANLDETEDEFRAIGLAGEAIVYAMRGERDLFFDRFLLVWPLRSELDPDMLDQLVAVASLLGST
jgi:serine/threonine-protein kinase